MSRNAPDTWVSTAHLGKRRTGYIDADGLQLDYFLGGWHLRSLVQVDVFRFVIPRAMRPIGRALAHTLDLAIVAEGVETSDQLDFLRARGCRRAQGYQFARPMPSPP